MKIEIIIKNVYGNELIYPNCDTSKAFCKIAKTKTLSIANLEIISKMGYQVEVGQQHLELLK